MCIFVENGTCENKPCDDCNELSCKLHQNILKDSKVIKIKTIYEYYNNVMKAQIEYKIKELLRLKCDVSSDTEVFILGITEIDNANAYEIEYLANKYVYRYGKTVMPKYLLSLSNDDEDVLRWCNGIL